MKRSWAIVLAAAIAGASAASAAKTPPALDSAVAAAAAQGFAGEVGVTDLAKTRYRRAVSAEGRPHRLGETWRWASVTKQLSATLAMQEVQAGRLSLDDTLDHRLPGFHGPDAARITLRMLLQHTSGLPNPDDTPSTPTTMPQFYLRDGAEIGGSADAYGYCAGAPKAAPGGRFSYNNCDFIVLGAVLEHLTGKTFPQLVDERIAKPLSLRTLKIAGGGTSLVGVKGFMDARTPEPAVNLAAFGASGGAYGSAQDLMAFDRALLNDRLLDAKATQTAWTGDRALGYVALGVWAFPAKLQGCDSPVDLVERRGEIGGVEVRNLIAPRLGRALAVFADRSDLDFGEIWQGRGLSYQLASAAFCASI